MIRRSKLATTAAIGLACTTALAAEPATWTIHADKPAEKIGPMFYGLMTEEINHAYDGGLYAELIQNRIFQDADKPNHWAVVTAGGGAGTIAIDTDKPVNDAALKRSLRLDVTAAGERVGVANDGFWGVPVRPNTKYRASFYARADAGITGPLTVTIENAGGVVAATASVPGINAEWKKYDVVLTTGDVPASADGRFVISTTQKGSLWLSLVSLFPPTFNDRPNGNRIDLMQKMAELRPKFLRFPGGNYLEGDTIDTRFKWKETIGPLEDRPGHMGCWSYRSSDGMGLLEFIHWCEDLKVEPILAVYAGYSLRGAYVKAGPGLQPFVQEALDEIEYCTGDAGTTWGARRIKDGHPDPFPIKYVEIGNEDWFDKAKSYDGRFTQFYDAIKAKYPQVQCISTMPVHSRRADLVDDHDYPSASAMLRGVARYRHRDPALPKVFFGEWATQSGKPTPDLRGALGDAAWLTGLQRDAETVPMNCYAPLFVHVGPGAHQWGTNLIGYDSAHSFGSASFYAQAMFNQNLGDVNVADELTAPAAAPVARPAPHGGIGLGTWMTAAEFKDVTVTAGNATLAAPDPAKPLGDAWSALGPGKWSAADGVFRQSDDTVAGPRLVPAAVPWTDYTVRLKARRISGDEGFIVFFHVRDADNYLDFNVGGWNNSRAILQRAEDGQSSELGRWTEMSIQTGRWYDLRVEVKGSDVKAFVDDKLLAEANDAPRPTASLFTAASRDTASGDLILKVVNASASPQPVRMTIDGAAAVAPEATLTQLSGKPADINSVDAPTAIAPQTSAVKIAGPAFEQTFPPHSFSVLRLRKP